MIGYVTLGTNILDRATDFYEALLAELGACRMFKSEKQVAWWFKESSTLLMISEPYDQQTATVGNGGAGRQRHCNG